MELASDDVKSVDDGGHFSDEAVFIVAVGAAALPFVGFGGAPMAPTLASMEKRDREVKHHFSTIAAVITAVGLGAPGGNKVYGGK